MRIMREHAGKGSQQQFVTFNRNQIADAEDSVRRRIRPCRRERPCIYAVVDDFRIYRGCRAIDHSSGNLVADTNHSRCGTIDKLRHTLAPSAGRSANLVVKECVQAVDGDETRNIQLLAQEHGSMSARQRSMSMNQIDSLRLMQRTDLRNQARIKKCSGSSKTDSPRDAGIADPPGDGCTLV